MRQAGQGRLPEIVLTRPKTPLVTAAEPNFGPAARSRGGRIDARQNAIGVDRTGIADGSTLRAGRARHDVPLIE